MPEDTSGVHVWLVLWKAAHAVKAHAQASLAGLPLCASDFMVLEVLLHKGPSPVNDIGRKVLLTSGSITVAVDRLEKQGLVERKPHSSDRRSRVVHLTAAGKKMITRAFAEHEKDMDRAVAGLEEKERAVLVKMLKKLGRGAEERLQE